MEYLMFLADCPAKSKVCVNVVGDGLPGELANLIHFAYIALQIAVPVALIIFGMIGFGKAIASQKEDEIKAAQNSFIKKIVIAVVIFLIFNIVHWVFNFAKGDNTIWGCVEKLLNAC